jgi:hypothetical protein
MGFGHSSRLHTTKVLRLAQDLPLVIEIVEKRGHDQPVRVGHRSMMGSALITTEKVKVIRYGNGKPGDLLTPSHGAFRLAMELGCAHAARLANRS